jgi:hypothetical protein
MSEWHYQRGDIVMCKPYDFHDQLWFGCITDGTLDNFNQVKVRWYNKKTNKWLPESEAGTSDLIFIGPAPITAVIDV